MRIRILKREGAVAEEQNQGESSGRYKLLELIEEGVCGKLYHARDAKEDKDVWVKLISRSVSKDPAFRRYLYDRWVDRDALFEHPNIVNIVEVGESGGQYFVAVEAPEGERLWERIKKAPLEVDEVLEILHQIAEALRAAHRRQVIHGHLKPSDVFLTRDQKGQLLVKVLFLDVSTSLGESVLPMFGEMQGSPKYMAPEVIRGGPPDAHSDIFSLGVIGYELLTGREPFPSSHPVGYLFANCQAPLIPAHAALESVPAEISLVVGRCLEKATEQRYRSAQRVIDDLDRCEEVLKTGNVSVVPRGSDSAFAREYELPPIERRPRRERGSRVSVMSVAALVLALAALVVALTLTFSGPRGRRPVQELPVAVGLPGRGAAQTGGFGQTTPTRMTQQERATAAAREQEAGKAYESLLKDWPRQSLRGMYELGTARFEQLAADYSQTSYAPLALEAAAQIYCEWAMVLAEKERYPEAEAKYRRAMELAQKNSRLQSVFEIELPRVMAQRADQLDRERKYEEALNAYRTIRAEFPTSVEATLLAQKKPGLQFKRGYDLWKHENKYEEAVVEFRHVVKNYPDSDAAADCRKYLPEIYLDVATAKVHGGRLEEARKDLAGLKMAYQDTPVGRKAAALDAQVLFNLYEAARQQDDQEAAARWFALLANEHPDTEWTQVAYRRRLGLAPAAGEVMFGPATAQKRYEDAENYVKQLRYGAALNTLRAVIRYTRPGSEVGRRAIAKLPEWSYFGALEAYGRRKEDGLERLQRLTEESPESTWSERAKTTLERIRNAPAGMVYVPEGTFLMGCSEQEIVRLLRPFYPARVLDSRNELNLVLSLVGYVSEIPDHMTTTKAFYIDETEVTNTQYKKFVGETDHRPPAKWMNGAYPEGDDDKPVANVSHEDAVAYAQWAGKRLPTETEWEKAARGVDGRFFPWGNVFDRNSCQHMRKSDAEPVAVGSYRAGASPYGALDMLGNVWEWTDSWFTAYPGNDHEDRRAAYGETCRVLRGGAWSQHDLKPVPTRVTFRMPEKPERTARDIGFRCVKDIE